MCKLHLKLKQLFTKIQCTVTLSIAFEWLALFRLAIDVVNRVVRSCTVASIVFGFYLHLGNIAVWRR